MHTLSSSVSMANHSRSQSRDLYSIPGIGSVCRAYKSLVSKLYPVKKNIFSRRTKAKEKLKYIEENQKDQHRHQYEEGANNVGGLRYNGNSSPRGVLEHQHHDHLFRQSAISAPVSRNTSPSRLSRTLSTKSRSTTAVAHAASPLRSVSHKSSIDVVALERSLSRSSLSRAPSRKSTSHPIMFSNSSGLIKPPPMEMTLECTLEELCFGCIKKIKITRDAVTNDGHIIEEDEMLTIKVKPGWTNGTKITFEGMGTEIPGADPSDVIFEVAELPHPLFEREGDDLKLAVTIPLVKALTRGDTSIDLIGGGKMNLTFDEIIYPGYQKVIAGQGMPKLKEKEHRGNLITTFKVQFPDELTDQQRSEVVSVLDDDDDDSCYSSP